MAKYTKEMFVRDGFDKYITNEWDVVAASSIFKEEFKDNEAEKEVILAYANALQCIAESLLKQNHSPDVVMTFRTNSLTIPFIFLARHTVELTLKYICRLLNIEYKPKHSLMAKAPPSSASAHPSPRSSGRCSATKTASCPSPFTWTAPTASTACTPASRRY